MDTATNKSEDKYFPLVIFLDQSFNGIKDDHPGCRVCHTSCLPHVILECLLISVGLRLNKQMPLTSSCGFIYDPFCVNIVKSVSKKF